MALGDEHQRSVELGHLVEEDVQVERQWLRRTVFVVVRCEVVVPLPLLTGEGFLGVDLDLLDVEVAVVEDLLCRHDEARVAHQAGEQRVAEVQPHGRAHHVAGSLAEVLCATLGEEAGQTCRDGVDLVVGEHSWEHDHAGAVERRQLTFVEEHRARLAIEARHEVSSQPRMGTSLP